ncbi:MAG: cysteine hydrolase family protein, partial [Acetanaerobacterium sp.]
MNNLLQLLPGTRTAVLVIDVQNDYCAPEGALAGRGCDVSGIPPMMLKLHKLIACARTADIPVIFIRTNHEEATDSQVWKMRGSGNMSKVCRKDSWGAEFFEVSPQRSEIVVIKHRYSAFINTRLDSVLRSLKIDTLIVTGVSTNVCVESTARDGCMLDYNIVFVADACASYNPAAHKMTLENIAGYFGTVCETEEIATLWQP